MGIRLVPPKDRKEILAAACHSAWYGYAVLALGEPGEPWESAPKWQKTSMRDAIDFWDVECAAMRDDTPLEEKIRILAPLSHVNWMEHKKSEFWVFGKEKDPVKKTHPCIVPYEELSHDQKMKDEVVLQAYLALRPLV